MKAALLRARQKAQQAMEDLHGGTITIGARTYRAAISLGTVLREPLDDGSGYRYVQRATISVLKTLLTTTPVQGTIIRLTPPGSGTALDFTLIEVGGQSTSDAAHLIHAMRLPPRP